MSNIALSDIDLSPPAIFTPTEEQSSIVRAAVEIQGLPFNLRSCWKCQDHNF